MIIMVNSSSRNINRYQLMIINDNQHRLLPLILFKYIK